jgi:hypothetical protein
MRTPSQNSKPSTGPLVLSVTVPEGTDPAILPSLRHGTE